MAIEIKCYNKYGEESGFAYIAIEIPIQKYSAANFTFCRVCSESKTVGKGYQQIILVGKELSIIHRRNIALNSSDLFCASVLGVVPGTNHALLHHKSGVMKMSRSVLSSLDMHCW